MGDDDGVTVSAHGGWSAFSTDNLLRAGTVGHDPGRKRALLAGNPGAGCMHRRVSHWVFGWVLGQLLSLEVQDLVVYGQEGPRRIYATAGRDAASAWWVRCG